MLPQPAPSDPHRAAAGIPAVEATSLGPKGLTQAESPGQSALKDASIGERNVESVPPVLRSKHVAQMLEQCVAEARTPQIREIYRERIAALFEMKSEGALNLSLSEVDALVHRLPEREQERLYAEVVAAVRACSSYFDEYERFEPLVERGEGPNNGHLAIPLIRQSYMYGNIFGEHMHALAMLLAKNGEVLPETLRLESKIVVILGFGQLFFNHPLIGVPLCAASLLYGSLRMRRTPEMAIVRGLVQESLLQSHFVSAVDEPMIQGAYGMSRRALVHTKLLASLRFLRLVGQTPRNLEALIPNAQFDKSTGVFPEVQAKVDRYAKQLGFAGDDTATLMQVTKDLHAIHRVESAILHHNGCVIAQRCLRPFM